MGVAGYAEIAKRGGGILNSADRLHNASEEELYEQAMRRIREILLKGTDAQAILREAGLELANVVKTTVLLADIADFGAMNEVYSEFFAQPYPARSAFAVRDLPKGALVEIECIAAK